MSLCRLRTSTRGLLDACKRDISSTLDISTNSSRMMNGSLGGQTRSPLRSPSPSSKRPRLDDSIANLASATTTIIVDPSLALPSASVEKNSSKKSARRRNQIKKNVLPEPCSNEDVIWRDVVSLLGQDAVDEMIENGQDVISPFGFKEEVELEVKNLLPNGEGLALVPSSDQDTRRQKWAIIVPFALPNETIRARIYRNARLHSFADLIKVITPNEEMRDMNRVKCRYFGSCAGCQYQMLSYEKQLELKREVVIKAYKNFANLPPSLIPEIMATIASPLQYGYRTKITPHFEAPPKKVQKSKGNENLASTSAAEKPEWLKIGFNQIGTRHVMDIEECPIATPEINKALGPLRNEIAKNIYSYKKGVSLLLRNSLDIRTTSKTAKPTPEEIRSALSHSHSEPPEICVTDHKGTIYERVRDKVFEYNAGSFFQNNNSILVPLTEYVRDAIFPDHISSLIRSATSVGSTIARPKPTHLVDAYCGSGLFSITLSSSFAQVSGIELSSEAITSATHSAHTLNSLSPQHISFLSGDASQIFGKVHDFPRDRTALIIDPPRKGCDEAFLTQVGEFGCEVVVYVSCNVVTQARDVGVLVRGKVGRARYRLESLRGFDLFPQTAHVESVAVLRRVHEGDSGVVEDGI